MPKANISISAAAELSRKFECPIVIIFALENEGGTFGVTSYGQTKKLCRHAADLARKFSKAVLEGVVCPAPTEPFDVPDQPTTTTYSTLVDMVFDKEGRCTLAMRDRVVTLNRAQALALACAMQHQLEQKEPS